jgi:uncharacterized membrane protein YbaN (DUF454 family)
VIRAGWAAVGIMCVALGAVGVIVPGLPTTVFFIGAAACFARSSPRLEAWVLGLPTIGPAVADYRAGRGMPRRAKVIALSMMTIAVATSVALLPSWPIRAVVMALGLIGAVAIARIPTRTSSN